MQTYQGHNTPDWKEGAVRVFQGKYKRFSYIYLVSGYVDAVVCWKPSVAHTMT